MNQLASSDITSAIEHFRRGRAIIVLDGPDRENEGDLVMAAELMTPSAVNFMTHHGRGLVCAALTRQRFETLQLDLMVRRNNSFHGTAFGVGVDLNIPGHTGISAFDRSATLQALANPGTLPEDLLRPGHIFPLRAAAGGLIERQGHTEAAVELARLAGLAPVGVLCEILDEDGAMARRPQLEVLAARFELPLITVQDLAKGLSPDDFNKTIVNRVSQAKLPTEYGPMFAIGFESPRLGSALALVHGDVDGREDVLLRIHSECLTGDVFGSTRCDCGEQLSLALHRISNQQLGLLIYLIGHEGRGIGLMKKLRAYSLQDQGWDTVEANHALGFPDDMRDYAMAAGIIRDLRIGSVRLLTNNPAKAKSLAQHGIRIDQLEAIEVAPRPENIRYLRTKRDKMGHLLSGLENLIGGSI
jgi:3,4-dihydroxy 2-butanone 4-phosphate synthase / GTP cyclohydrolase II